MRGILLAAALVLGPAPDDPEARALYTALRKKIETADTLAIDFTLATPPGRGHAADQITGSLLMKGKDHWSLSLQTKNPQRPDLNTSLMLLSDGKRVTGAEYTDLSLDPPSLAARFRRTLPDSLLSVALMPRPGPGMPEPAAPKEEEIRDGGTETLDGVAARILLYPVEIEKQKFTVKAWVDPAGPRLLKRTLSMGARGTQILMENFGRFAANEPIPDGAFVFASLRRLAQARAKQLARSAALFGMFTGRTPKSLDELVARPKDLAESIVWPPGGFILGGAVPKDPWGRAFTLEPAGARLVVSSRGADGKPGGIGDDEDLAADVPFSIRMAVAGPTPRVKAHYEARIQIQLIAAAVKAYRETYGELPRKKADLFEKPALELIWPDDDWIPGRKMPLDPWGEEIRLITDVGSARVQVQDPKARLLTYKLLTAEERSALESAGKPVLTPAERAEIAALVVQLRDDDLDTRQKAQTDLRRYGPAAEEAVVAHLAVEKDAEAKSRLEEIRRSLPRLIPTWRTELAVLSAGVFGDGQPANMAANERNASTTMKTLASAEADFRANDRDWNHVNDFWTGDVAGLYTVKDDGGNSVKLIELSVALADAAPLPPGAGGKLPDLSTFGVAAPKAGYWFRAMDTDVSAQPPEELKTDTGGVPKMGKVHNTSKFGYCGYPAEYGVSGTRTFILNENNTIFWKDTQGEPVLEWPTDADLAAEWKKLD